MANYLLSLFSFSFLSFPLRCSVVNPFMDNILPSAPDKVILFFNRQPISFPPHQTTCSCYITDTSAIPILSSYRPLICLLPVDWPKRILHDGLPTVQKSVGPRFTGTAAQNETESVLRKNGSN